MLLQDKHAVMENVGQYCCQEFFYELQEMFYASQEIFITLYI